MKLKEKYNKQIIKALQEKHGYKNVMQVPHLDKVVLNVGINSKHKDEKLLDAVRNTLTKISGQKPSERTAKKSISSFKIREGQLNGMMVTLRGKRMYEFIDKLVNLTLPRVRDFRGLSTKSFDGHGNYSLGFREQVAFPELRPEDLDKLHGLEIVIATTANTDEEARDLLNLLGFPFKKEK